MPGVPVRGAGVSWLATGRPRPTPKVGRAWEGSYPASPVAAVVCDSATSMRVAKASSSRLTWISR